MRKTLFLLAALTAFAIPTLGYGGGLNSSDFEAPTYKLGNLHMQDGWSVHTVSGKAYVQDNMVALGRQAITMVDRGSGTLAWKTLRVTPADSITAGCLMRIDLSATEIHSTLNSAMQVEIQTVNGMYTLEFGFVQVGETPPYGLFSMIPPLTPTAYVTLRDDRGLPIALTTTELIPGAFGGSWHKFVLNYNGAMKTGILSIDGLATMKVPLPPKIIQITGVGMLAVQPAPLGTARRLPMHFDNVVVMALGR